MSRSRIAEALLVAAALAGAARAQGASGQADAAAKAALPRAEVRTLSGQVRTIRGLDAATGGAGSSIGGEVVSIAQVQRGLEGSGLATRMVNGALEVSLPGDVLFDFDKATIRPSALTTLEKVRAAAVQTGGRPVKVEGHTDAVGKPAYNQRLSEERARAVADWLAGKGIPAARLASAGFGATRPVAANRKPGGSDDPEGRQRNRRVTVLL